MPLTVEFAPLCVYVREYGMWYVRGYVLGVDGVSRVETICFDVGLAVLCIQYVLKMTTNLQITYEPICFSNWFVEMEFVSQIFRHGPPKNILEKSGKNHFLRTPCHFLVLKSFGKIFRHSLLTIFFRFKIKAPLLVS